VVIQRPPGVGSFQFVVLAMLRASQLMRGCRPRVDGGHKATVIAQLEVSAGKVMQVFTLPDTNGEPTTIGAVSEDAPTPVRII
jgi:DNA-directed RNA polymerase subunit K/omega